VAGGRSPAAEAHFVSWAREAGGRCIGMPRAGFRFYSAVIALGAALYACVWRPPPIAPLAPIRCNPDSGAALQGRLAWSVTIGRGPFRPLGVNDWRRRYTGKWSAQLTLDSLQEIVHRRSDAWSAMHPVEPACVTSGTLTIADSVGRGAAGQVLPATLDMSFKGVLGGPIDWWGRVSMDRAHDSLQLSLSPGCSDCGVIAILRPYTDSLVGVWFEDSFVGYSRAGRLTLRRMVAP
jgi:hypothetical protein